MLMPILFLGFVVFLTLLAVFFASQSRIRAHIRVNHPSIWEKWVHEAGYSVFGSYEKIPFYLTYFAFQMGDYRILADEYLNRVVRKSWIALILLLMTWFLLLVGLIAVF